MATFLTPDRIEERQIGSRVLRVNQKIMPDNYPAPKYVASYVKSGEPMKPCRPLHGDGTPLGITVHNTEMINVDTGTTAAEQYTRATYNGNMGGVIVHYYVWRSVIWQLLDDRERGWHATDGSSRRLSKDGKSTIGGNMDCIAIEAIGADDETEATTAALCAWLCRTYGLLPVEDVYPHQYFYPAKYCPSYILPHWDAFLKRVKTIYLEADPPETSPADEPDEWAKEAWAWAKMLGYMDGTRPREAVTREMLAVVLHRVKTDMD